MDAYSSIMSRRSVRAFKAEMPPMDLVMKVVDAGRYAPSGMNTQKWHFTVVVNKEKIKEIGSYVLSSDKSICYDAPVFIMVSYEADDFFRAMQDFSVPSGYRVYGSLALGYPEGEVRPRSVKPSSETVSIIR